jgi:hypothetical protein
MNRGVLLAVHLPLIRHLFLTHKKDVRPNNNRRCLSKTACSGQRMCFVDSEVIDTTGQQLFTTFLILKLSPS